MTVNMYRHCEEEIRCNPLINSALNRITSMVIINYSISLASCTTATPNEEYIIKRLKHTFLYQTNKSYINSMFARVQ